MPKIKNIYGYDLDGVLAIMSKRDKPYSKQNKYERKEFEKIRAEMYENSPLLLQPVKPFYIISGRKEKYRSISDTWLKKNKLNPIKTFYLEGGKNFENILKLKVSKIKESKITVYYEDDVKLIREIQKALPSLQVVRIKRDTKNVKVIHIQQPEQIKLF
jgi:hypothetical protein